MLKFISYINNSRWGRLIIWPVAGIILLAIFSFCFWQQYLADNLIKYAPEDTIFYAHFSLPLTKHSDNFNNLFLKVLADNNLGDLKLADIKREAALVGEAKDGQWAGSLIIKADRAGELKKYLAARGLAYKFLSGDTVVIAPSPEILAGFRKNNKNAAAVLARGHLSHFNSLSIMAAKPFFQIFNEPTTAMLYEYLADINGVVYLNFQIKAGDIRIFSSKKLVPAQAGIQSRAKIMPNDFDLIFSTTRAGDLANGWGGELNAVSPGDYAAWQNIFRAWQKLYAGASTDQLISKLAGSKVLLVVKNKPESVGWFVSDNDFYLSFDLAGGNFEAGDIKQIENILKSIVARQYPSDKNVYLNDGTRVVEIRPDISDFEFTAGDGLMVLTTPDKKYSLYYKLTDGKMEIFNNPDLLAVAEKLSLNNYLKISRKFLPNISFWPFAQPFDYIELNGSSLFLPL